MALLLFILAMLYLGSTALTVEKIDTVPSGWEARNDGTDPFTPIQFSFGLKRPQLDELFSTLPRKIHIDRTQAGTMRQPDQQHIDIVMKWLSENGFDGALADGTWIHVSSTAGEAEELLGMKLRPYAFQGGKEFLRTTEYSIPDFLSHAIDFVHPITNFMSPGNRGSRFRSDLTHDSVLKRQDIACTSQVTIDCIKQLYNVDYTTSDNKSAVRFGIAGFLEDYANFDDMNTNLHRSRPDLEKAGYNFSVELISGGENPQDSQKAGVTANLNTQFGMSIGYPTNVVYFSTAGRGQKIRDDGSVQSDISSDNEPYLELLEYLLDQPEERLPTVLSIPYADDELSVPKPYAEKVCADFGMLTARGVSVIVASGDGGAKGSRGATCRTNDGTNKDTTVSTFPASCPWVTSVGAVNGSQSIPVGADFSSGGFSGYFARPDWQDAAVEEYLTALNGHLEGYYNPNMRAVPDVSVIGTGFEIIIGGSLRDVEGTDASTPVFAAMVSLINDARIRQGKQTLGFLNKKLYSEEVRAVLEDVSNGQSFSCVFTDGQEPGGWPATRGFDAITGLGVPSDFQKLLNVLLEA